MGCLSAQSPETLRSGELIECAQFLIFSNAPSIACAERIINFHQRATYLGMLFFEYVTFPQKNCEEVVFLNAALPSDLLIPQKLILKTIQQTIREKCASLLKYYSSNGSLELRKNILQRSANTAL